MFDELTIKNVSAKTLKRIQLGLPLEDDKVRFTKLKIWLGENRTIQTAARKIMRYGVFADREKKTDKTIKKHNAQQIVNAQSFDSSFGYKDDLSELNVAIKYLKQIENGFPTASESKVLYETVVEKLTEFCSTQQIPVFLNFGVCLAHVDYILAQKFADIHFVGIDRSKLTKAFNEIHYPKRKNLELISGDIFELLNSRSFAGGALFHMRTLPLLPKEFIEKLYNAAEKAGFKYIIGYEPHGISRQTKEAYEFSLDQQPSVAYRGHAFIHNYPELAQEAGYSFIESGLIKTGHAHEDYRIVYFVSERKGVAL